MGKMSKERKKINYLEPTGEKMNVFDGKRGRKMVRVWCKHCHNYSWVREDSLKYRQSCGCLSRGFRARWLFNKRMGTWEP